MTTRPRLLDLFCCEGGAGVGYQRAGFDVLGVDYDPQPRNPLPFQQADALKYLMEHWPEFDAYHASPPCQAHTNAQKIRGNSHPDYIVAIRSAFELCGSMFGLATYRHRLFESNIALRPPPHPAHVARTTKMGRPPQPGEFMHIVGNFSGVDRAREVMGMPWASRDGLREAIPPVYSEFVGAQLLAALAVAA